MSTTTVARDSVTDLWARAVAQVPDKYQQNINFSSDVKNEALRDLHIQTETARKKAIDSRWKLTRKNGETVIIRDVAEKIVRWINLFSKVGDAVTQYDPGHAALPWAAVRFVLQMAVNDSNTLSSVVEGLARIAELICRYAVVEDLYFQHVSKGASELERALTKLYVDILCYLSVARQYVEERTAKRVFKGALLPNTELETGLDNIRKSETDARHCQTLVTKEDQDQDKAQTKAQFDQVNTKLIDIQASFDAPFRRMDDSLKKIQDNLDTKERNDILKWCSPHPYMQHHKLAKQDVLPGTGQWLLSDPVFNNWKEDSASNILWLHGKPGAGKTKLVSIVIEDARKSFATGNNPPPVFFYCSRDEADTRGDPGKILASIARQLSCLEAGKPLLKPTKDLYDEAQAMGLADIPLLMDESYKLILELIEFYPLTVIVLDALDECSLDNRSKLLDFSENIIHESSNLVKVFISSRDDGDIKSRLRDYPNIEVNGERNRDDIALFVKGDVENRIRSKRLLRHSDITSKSSMKGLLIDKVSEGADGMFRWASMQLQYLCTIDDADIKEHLGRLSKQSLETLYSDIYDILSTQPGHFARTIFRNSLHWLLCAQRNLLPNEFYAAISIDLEISARGDVTEDRVLDICNNFIIFDSELDTFRFAHLSVREFLEQRSGYSSSTTHALAAEICLRNVISASHHPATPESAFLIHKRGRTAVQISDGFRRYSDLYWGAHCKLALDERKENTLKDILRKFLSGSGKGTSNIEEWAIRLGNYPRNDDDFWIIWDSELEYPSELKDIELSKEVAAARRLFVSCVFDFDEFMEGVADEHMQKMAWLNKQGRTPLQVAARNGSCTVLGYLLDPHGANVTITKELVEEAAENRNNGKEVMKLLLDRRRSDVSITPAVVEKAARNTGNGMEVMELLLDRRQADVSITAAVVKAAARNYRVGQDIMKLLLKQDRGNLPITELAEEIAQGFGEEVLSCLLDQQEVDVSIIGAAIKGAAWNYSTGNAIMRFLIDKYREEIIAAEAIIALIARHSDKHTVEYLYGPSRTDISIPKTIIEAASRNFKNGEEIIKFLISRCKANMPTKSIILAIAEYFNQDVMACLLDRCGTDVLITGIFAKEIVKASSWNSSKSNGIMKLLLDQCKVESPISKGLVVSTARNFDHEVMECLLKQPGAAVVVDLELVRAATSNRKNGDLLMKFLLDRCRVETGEIEAIGASIAQRFSREVMACLLGSHGEDLSITHEMVKAAAANSKSGKEVMALLLDQCKADVSITEEIVKVVVRNNGSGREIMSLLLDRPGADIEVTKGVAEAAASNSTNGEDIMKLLLTKYRADRSITEATVLAIARRFDLNIIKDLVQCRADMPVTKKVTESFAGCFDKEATAFLLSRRGVEILITESIVDKAAGNSKNGKAVLELLLNPLNQCTLDKPTEPIVLAIARKFDQDVMACLLDRRDVEVSITKSLVQEIADNSDSGKGIMELLLKGCRVDMPIEALVLAINRRFDHDVMACLLDRPGTDVLLTEEIVSHTLWYRKAGNTIIRLLLNRCRTDTPIPEAIVLKIANGFDQDVLTCLLNKREGNIPLTEQTVLAIVRRCSQDSITRLLKIRGREVPITKPILEIIARRFDQGVLVYMLDQGELDALITEREVKAVVQAAAANRKNGKEVMALLLDRYQSRVKTTESVIKTVVRNEGNGREIMSLLLDRRGAGVVVTEDVIEAAAENSKNGKDIMMLLLNQHNSKMSIKKVTEAIAEHFDQEVMARLLEQHKADVSITERLVEATAENSENGKDIMKLLLNQCREETLASDTIVAAIAQHFDPDVMASLLHRRNPDALVTEAVVYKAARNKKYHNVQGKDMIMRLIDKYRVYGREFEAIQAIAENFDQEVTESLLNRPGTDVSLTEGLVRATERNHKHGNYIITLLLNRCRTEISVAEEVAIEIADSFNQETMICLIDQHGANIPITEAVLLAIIKRFDQNLMRYLLDLRGADISVTKAVIKAAAKRNVGDSREMMGLLFGQRGASTSFTESIVEAASGKWVDGEKIIIPLLHEWGSHIQVTEEVVKAAAGNEKCGDKLIQFLLDQRREDVQITEEVMRAAAGNEACCHKVMTLLLGQLTGDGQITEEMVKAVANEAYDIIVMTLLLDRLGEAIQITEEVVKAAASNGWCGDEVMTLLLDQRGEQVHVTEEVVKAAAGNEFYGDEVMKILLDRRGEDVRITGEVVKAAAGNLECGSEVMTILLNRRGDDPQIPDDVKVAIGRHWSGMKV